MKKNKSKAGVYPIIWSGIIVVSIYLIIRFAALSFSDNVGQARLSFKKILSSKLLSMSLENGSSLISYTENGDEQYPFLVGLVSDQFALQKFTDNPGVLKAKAQEYNSLPDVYGGPDMEYSKNITNMDASADVGMASIQTMNNTNGREKYGYYEIAQGSLSKEYILTNGAVYNKNLAGETFGGLSGTGMTKETVDELQIGYTQGDVYCEETEAPPDPTSVETAALSGTKYTMDELKDLSFLVRNFYIVDKSTKVTDTLFNAEELLSKDMKLKQSSDKPQILIYHTHSHEAYADSRADHKEDTVVGAGNCLADILTEQYGYNVIHDTTSYDDNRDVAYSIAEKGLNRIFEENPSIEVVIDLHRDEGNARTTVIDGKETANIMLFNGLCRDQSGPLTKLDNPNLQDNLAFSLQMQLKSLDLYPGLFIKNYLRNYRFNMHVRPKCLLVELGTVNNTVESAKNAMEPFARVLDSVLQGK